jgi:hypothetical protein
MAGWRNCVPYLIIALVYLVIVIQPILTPEIDVFDHRDEAKFHYPTIVEFRAQFPDFVFSNYMSATTPLYHVGLATISYISGTSVLNLRVVNALFCLLGLLWFSRYLIAGGGAKSGLILSLLFMASPYFIGPAVRLSTDNAALILAMSAMIHMARFRSGFTNRLVTIVLITGAILTRQIYVWLLGVYFFNLLWRRKDDPRRQLLPDLLLILIPAGLLIYFILLWQGLTPPRFSSHTQKSIDLEGLIFSVSVLGLYGAVFGVWLMKMVRGFEYRPLAVIVLISVMTLIFSPVSNWYDNFERGGWIWLVVSKLPMVGGTSIVFWALFPLGLIVLGLLMRYLFEKREWAMAVMLPLWFASSVVNTKIYQKYYEPWLLFVLGYVIISLRRERWFAWAIPSVMVLGFLVVDYFRFIR